MKEQLISFETAKLVKKKGFPFTGSTTYKVVGILESSIFGTPLTSQSLLQKWLREKHNIHVLIYTGLLSLKEPKPMYTWKILIPTPYTVYQSKKRGFEYEEALEKGLQEALKLI